MSKPGHPEEEDGEQRAGSRQKVAEKTIEADVKSE